MTPQELKNSILQLAIQGKLVEQRVEEGTAAELLRDILTQRRRDAECAEVGRDHRARRNGRLAAPQPPIPDDEKPFDIPESWEWVRLGEVVFNHGQKTPSEDFSYIDIGSIDNKNQRLSEKETIVHASDASPRARKIVNKGDVLYATVRPYLHNVCIIDRDFSHEPIASTGFAVMACAVCLDNRFLFHFLLSPDFDRYANSAENAKGVAYPAISDKRLYNAIIPLPPLAEQKRIVAKIEELLPLIDRYEKAWSKLEDFNKRFPVDMQKSLLQMAIQGKLVEQRSEEGTAAELLRDVLTQRRRDAEVGRSPRDRRVSARNGGSGATALPPIPDDEKPFDIPESWEWVRLSQIAKAIVDCPHSTPKYLNCETEYCTIDTNCINEKGEIIKWRYVDAGTYQVRIARLVPQKDDIVYTREGSICRAAQLPDNKNICLGQRVMLVRCAHGMFPQFLRRMLMSPAVITKLTEQQKGIGAKHVNVSDVCNLLIPLPPLAEQKRIVAKLEELLPLCERLK